MRLLSLRTVINLSREALTRVTTVFLAENNIQVADVGLQVWTHPTCEPISHELVTEAMRYVLDQAHHPLLIVSASGTHQVGAVVGCLRRLQHWTLAATLDEYRRYAAPSPRPANEQFIELWDCDLLTLPLSLPPWFEQQRELLEEEATRWRDLHGGARGWHRSCSQCSIASCASETAAPSHAPSPSGAPASGAFTAPPTTLGAPLLPQESMQWWHAPGDVAADGMTPMRVDGPLVPPGTKTSTIDAED